jgi:phospholipase C
MKVLAKMLIATAVFGAAPAYAITNFQHIVIVVQENRTPDNLFYGLCGIAQCSTTDATKYDIKTAQWLDKDDLDNDGTAYINPMQESLGTNYDVEHYHVDWKNMCDRAGAAGPCRMDGAGDEACPRGPHPTCPFTYVNPSDVASYLTIATSYGWANRMFQTNQGPSFPAHQFIFGATSAPSTDDDHAGTFASENSLTKGCVSPPNSKVTTITADGVEHVGVYPCFEHNTISDLIESQTLTWKYYTTAGAFSPIWTAPYAINHICGPSTLNDGICHGQDFANVDFTPSDVLNDAGFGGNPCKLPALSWVIPDGADSDHAGGNHTGGPSWVTSIVDAIGESPCTNPDGTSYWNTTAIVITWDDWGGWYDHVPPTFLAYPEGGYQLGFRVPLLFVSAYTPAGYIDNARGDFGSIARFVEHNFGVTEGALTFADARTCAGCTLYNLSGFYNLSNSPRTFVHIPSRHDARWFLHRKIKPSPPDDDD